MPKVTPRKEGNVVHVKTKATPDNNSIVYKWWKANSKAELANQVLSTVGVLKEQQQYRYRQAGIYARLYGNMPLWNFVGSNLNKMSASNNLPLDRPTMNVVQSVIDTKVSRLTQSRPRPIFLTERSNYKKRKLAKQLNTFIMGEFYNTQADQLSAQQLRDAEVLGTGCLKVFEKDNRVAVERVLLTELLVDPNESIYGDPRQLFQLKLVDRAVLAEIFPNYKSDIAKAEQAYPDLSADSTKTVSDQVMVVEAWHLPSSKDASDGRHTIACSAGVIFDEEFKKPKFPFVFMHSNLRLMGFWGQGAAERLMGTQVEINKLLSTISSSINLVGVPRVFVEDGSKVVKAHLNNNIGAIVTYRGTKPQYEVAPCVPVELYQQLERLVNYAYQQEGVNSLAAQGQKPAGLNSGEALRNYDDIQSDRFSELQKRFVQARIELAYLMVDKAATIAEREGKYRSVYPNKDGTQEVDLGSAELMLEDTFVIQCFDSSSLPRDPAGRMQKVTEMIQSGMITLKEGRRLLDFPDLEQIEQLANAGEERILKILDEIVEDGKYTPPDPFMDIQLGIQLVTQYYNLYSAANLTEERAQMLRDFFSQLQALMTAAQPPAQPQPAPQATPQPLPQSPLVPNNVPSPV